MSCQSQGSRVVVGLATLIFLWGFTGCDRGGPQEVVVYASQDQVYAEPLLSEFTKQTGIRVRPVFDSEAVKTVGLAQRLINESSRPQCDVFWNNEKIRTLQLASRELWRRTNGWTAFGYRSRRIVICTKRLSLVQAPANLLALTNAVWRGKVALGYPLYGTTATHFLALRQQWGQTAWLQWCRALHDNRPFLLDGNSQVVKLVGTGEAWLGLTDSDDIAAGQREGLPIAAVPVGPDSLLIPNTVAVVGRAPHPEAADQLFKFLQSPRAVRALIKANALEGADRGEVNAPTLQPDWNKMVDDLGPAVAALKTIFLR